MRNPHGNEEGVVLEPTDNLRDGPVLLSPHGTLR